MKKFFVFLTMLIFSSPVLAKSIPVEALNDFSTENPPETIDVKILSDIVLVKQQHFSSRLI